MRIIWADHDPSWGVSGKDHRQEDPQPEPAKNEEYFSSETSDDISQEKSSWKELKGFG